jgi:hypothetical protein
MNINDFVKLVERNLNQEAEERRKARNKRKAQKRKAAKKPKAKTT